LPAASQRGIFLGIPNLPVTAGVMASSSPTPAHRRSMARILVMAAVFFLAIGVSLILNDRLVAGGVLVMVALLDFVTARFLTVLADRQEGKR